MMQVSVPWMPRRMPCDRCGRDAGWPSTQPTYVVDIETARGDWVSVLCLACVTHDFGLRIGIQVFVGVLGSLVREARFQPGAITLRRAAAACVLRRVA